MTLLMIHAGDADPRAEVTRTGGLPSAPAGFEWPRCAECGGALRFLGQVLLADVPGRDGDDRLVLLFQCDNDPGACETWEAGSGSTAAPVVARGGLSPAGPPTDGVTVLGAVSGVRFEVSDVEDYGEAREEYGERTGEPLRVVLGQLGGSTYWLQADRTPGCPDCGKPMTSVAHLEEGRHGATAANFGGGGIGYAFLCDGCPASARFFWQV
ncbi:hypothetical protein [Saccharothrix longispora]|uniref:hypothetical protein n=1 Tax=Saccharothrix longispora TaxID=33920 RepID=UPI0028FD6E34|nr:hypothetical protein [Saccharothrix longispora]MDU0288831.1 hypothetical protein [Saccharothrix longispora]